MDTAITIMAEAEARPAPAEGAALLRLLAWLSPAFPTGGFSYSHGLEHAVHDGLVGCAADLANWIEDLIRLGSLRNDAILFSEAWRCGWEAKPVAAVAELAEALAGSAERHREAMLQGAAFLAAARPWLAVSPSRADMAYCVAVGWVSGQLGVPIGDALAAFLHAFASAQLQAAIRLGVMGQQDAARLLAGFEPMVLAAAATALQATTDDLGSCTLRAEVAAMAHETQYSRLFRS